MAKTKHVDRQNTDLAILTHWHTDTGATKQHVAKEQANHSVHQRDIIKEFKKVWHLLALLYS